MSAGSSSAPIVLSDLDAQLQTYVGQSAAPPSSAPDPVNQPMIRHWVEAMGDENPVYVDPEAAASSIHGGIVAPPTMLQAWGMKGLRGRLPDAPTGGESGLDVVMDLLNAAGYTSVVATNCEQTYPRYLRLGDHLVSTQVIDSISGEKTTALGTGYFVTTRTDYRTKEGELVGSMTFRILKFRPVGVAP